MFNWLKWKDIYVNIQNEDGDTALIIAAKNGHIGVLIELLKINELM